MLLPLLMMGQDVETNVGQTPVYHPRVLLDSEQETWYEMGDSILIVPKSKPNFIRRVMNYLLDDKDHSKDKLWISVLGGPHYDSDTKFGLALIGNAYFRVNGSSHEIQPSIMTARLDVTTTGYVSTRLNGNTLLANDRRRFNYEVEFESLPSYFWGINYDMCDINENETRMKRNQAHLNAEFLWRVAPKTYIGPVVNWNWVKAKELDRMELLGGQPLCTRNYGFGFTADFDGRDQIVNADKGFYAHVTTLFYPKKLWNEYAFTRIDTRFCFYQPAWKGAVIATELRGMFNVGNPVWAMMAQPGDSYYLRGYYKGRYRDKHAITFQAEIRQHIWNRLGAVVWGGCGSLFHDAGSMKNLLPNVGVGLRWAFRHRMNVRIDYGWGRRGEHGFTFAMNEAF